MGPVDVIINKRRLGCSIYTSNMRPTVCKCLSFVWTFTNSVREPVGAVGAVSSLPLVKEMLKALNPVNSVQIMNSE